MSDINISIRKRKLRISLKKFSTDVVNQNPNIEFSKDLQLKDINQT